MGLVVPMFASIVAALSLIIATGLAVSSGRLAWIDTRTSVTTATAMFVAVGIGTLMISAFFAWADRWGSWVAPLGIVGAGIAPLVVFALLIASRAPLAGQLASPPIPRVVTGALAPIALAGFLLGAFALTKLARSSAESVAARNADDAEFESKAQQMRNRTPIEAAREDMAALSPTAPLWTIISRLPDVTDSTARGIIIERALNVPNFNDELSRTIASDFPRYRHGCLVLIQYATKRDSAWSALVVKAVDVSTREINESPTWFTPDEMRNPHPVEHVRVMDEVAALFPNDATLAEALAQLHTASVARDGLKQPAVAR